MLKYYYAIYKSENGNDLVLYNFSIVNGGQTTNLVGRASFDTDFAIMCKVIKNKSLGFLKSLGIKINYL